MKTLRWTFGLILCGSLAACGGKVVVDVGGAGGMSSASSAGAGPGSSGSGQGHGGGTSTCLDPPDPATLTWCGGSSGAAPQTFCQAVYCDMQGNSYEADCKPTTCNCKLNGQTLCTCALNGPGDICWQATPHCCPFATLNGP
jgi:hypothetical protein